MLRRDLLKGLMAAGSVCSLPLAARLETSRVSTNTPLLFNAKDQFNLALKNEPGLIGLTNVASDFSSQQLKLDGALPKDLQGVFYRNGPAKHERGDIRYQHLFEGDGMVQRFQFHNGQIHHVGRFIQTPKFVAEQQAKQFLYDGPETKINATRATRSADSVNVANTSLLPVGDDLWALWEAGSATAIDAYSLDFKRQVDLGANTKYGNSLKGLPFSAHPKVDTNGDIWNFGLSHTGHTVLYHLSKTGQLKNVKLVDSGYTGKMLHDFLITDKHVLLILPSLTSKQSRGDNKAGFFSQIKFDANLPMRVMVFKKADFSLVKQYELPPGFVFHFGNAWEDKTGVIRFDASLYPNIEILQDMSNMMVGDVSRGHTNSKMALFELHPNGKTSHQVFDIYSEFPKVFGHKQGLKNDKVFHLSTVENTIWNDTVCAFDTDSGHSEQYSFGKNYHVEEHIPITTNANNTYLIGTALHVPTKTSCINVFDSNNIAQGPLVQAWLNHHLPLGFHGCFVA